MPVCPQEGPLEPRGLSRNWRSLATVKAPPCFDGRDCLRADLCAGQLTGLFIEASRSFRYVAIAERAIRTVALSSAMTASRVSVLGVD